MKTIMGMRKRAIDGGYCIELEKDMITMKSKPVMVIPGEDLAKGTSFEDHAFFEASSPRKIGDTYYLVYSSVLSHELCYAVSSRPDGGFVYGGTLISIGDIGYEGNTTAKNYLGNTHGGMVEIDGRWYIFYHRQTNKQKCCRQGCAEKINIAPDGTIAQAEITSCGLNNGPLSGTGTYEARIACNLGCDKPNFAYLKVREKDTYHPYFTQTGSDREENGDQYIANMKNGAWAGFKYFEFHGEDRISLSLRGNGKGHIFVSTEMEGVPMAQIPVDPSNDWKMYSGVMKPLQGVHALYLCFVGTGGVDFMSFACSKQE